MMNSTLTKRLSVVPEEELGLLLGMFRDGTMPVFDAGMADHFRIAKEKAPVFANHGNALGISFGGTNTKLILCSMENGSPVVHHATAAQNPPVLTHLYDFFDGVLLGNPVFAAYLRDSDRPVVGISVPTRVLGKIPYHETKVPTIDGLLARNKSQMTEEYDLSRSFAKYLKTRGLRESVLFYQADGIVAHHGAVSLCDMAVDDRSTLIVCGTGMATGDEVAYIQIGIANILNAGDQELFPDSETENRQFHYATAGKGIFSLMNRAIKIRAKEPGSALARYDLSSFFCGNKDTLTVGLIWGGAFGDPPAGRAKEIAGLVSADAYRELVEISDLIMRRCVVSIAASTVSTVAKMGRAPGGRGHIIFFEGSVANDKYGNPLIREMINRLSRAENVYGALGFEPPLPPVMDVEYKRILTAKDVPESILKKVDLTSMGAATMAMAEHIKVMEQERGR